MADGAVMVAIGVATLGRTTLQERGGRSLELGSGIVIGPLGLVPIVAPEWLFWGWRPARVRVAVGDGDGDRPKTEGGRGDGWTRGWSVRDAVVPIAVVLALLVVGCDAPAEPRSVGATPADEATARANAAADDLARTLRARRLAAMSEGGPALAVRVCADEAQRMAAEVAARHGARVGRSSLRLRNPADAPPEWVAAWLAAQGERFATGITGFARVEDGQARVLRPIVVEGPCLGCHGPAESIAPEVAALLRERYPGDAATGYRIGDLRGALWAEADLAR